MRGGSKNATSHERRCPLAVRPNWRRFVVAEDWEYVREIIDDLKDRAKFAPEALFDQAGSLSVGPIVACDVGSEFVLDLYQQFDDV